MNSTRPLVLRTFAAVALATAIGLAPAGASAQIRYAKATRVGDVPPANANGDSVVSLTASFSFAGALDLGGSKLTLSTLLDEAGAGGAGELLEGFAGTAVLPVTLGPRRGSSPNAAIYESSGRPRPGFRVAVRRYPGDVFQVRLRVNRATISTGPALCTGTPATTLLTTTLSFGDGLHPPVLSKTFVEPWLCQGSRLRISTGQEAPSTPDGNLPPVAALVTEQLTRETGVAAQLRFDATGSTDADGTIESYVLSVVARDSGAVVFGPTTSAAPTVEATFAPGDYVARLTVQDNLGAVSRPARRGFTVH